MIKKFVAIIILLLSAISAEAQIKYYGDGYNSGNPLPIYAPAADNCTTPPYSFIGQTTSGMCSPVSGQWAYRSNGTNVFEIATDGSFRSGTTAEPWITWPLPQVNSIAQDYSNARIGATGSYMDHLSVNAFFNPTAAHNKSLNGMSMSVNLGATSSGSVSQINGVYAAASNWGAANVTNSLAGVTSFVASSWNAGTGVVTSQNGIMVVSANVGDGSITTSRGVFIESPSNDGANNNVTNTYGLYVEDQDRGTNKWNIYSAGATSRNTFEGSLSVGSTLTAGSVAFTASAFASLGSPTDGTVIYCSDCTSTTVCSGSGTGAIARRLSGSWSCAAATASSVLPGTAASLGSDLITNGSFATGDCTGWTCGAGWSAATSAAVHTAGSVEALSQSVTVTAGTVYQIGFTQSATPSGTLTFSLGAATSAALDPTKAVTYHPTLTAAASGAVTFSITPDTNYNGTLDSITLKPITSSTPVDVAGVKIAPITASGGSTNLWAGTNAGYYNHEGHGNVGLGYNAAPKLTTASGTVAVGYNALSLATSGNWNHIVGAQGAPAITTGDANSGLGYNVFNALTTGYSNVAIGVGAMAGATTGYKNIAIGPSSMGSGALIGYQNIGIGEFALLAGTDATQNVCIGGSSCDAVTTGDFNTALGHGALSASTIYLRNTCVGYTACAALAASSNTAIGADAYSGAGAAGNYNTCIGQEACYKSGATPATANTMTTASNNTFVGYEAGLGSTTQRTNSGCIGYQCYVDADNTFVIGDENVTSILASSDGGATVTAAAFKVGANTGVSGTVVVKGSDGNNCNLVFEGGILTSETCP